MNVLSLFSGIGGLELGLERAGMRVVGQVEIDEYCRRVLARHWPEVPRHDDVRTCVDWWRSESRPVVDLACGGFPCQPVSVAGRRQAQADPRWLWPPFAATIGALRPRYVLVENVPGLLAHGLGDILGDLASLGYDTEWDRIPAALVGAPHLRGRVFIVAYPQREQLRNEPVSEQWGGGTTVPGDNGSTGAVANPQRLSGQLWSTTSQRQGRSTGGRFDLADPNGRSLVWAPVTRPERDHWTAEPDVGRVAHGVPARLDRLRALGNAVVPQVAEHVGRLIMTAHLAAEQAS